MDAYRMQFAPRHWPPQLKEWFVKIGRPMRTRLRKRDARLMEVEVRGAEHVRKAVQAGQGVLITPNHSAHADCYAMYDAADQVGHPFYFMCAWQVFGMKGRLTQRILQWHGCFSVDRESADMQAFKQAVELLQKQRAPLVIFPEGEVYHCNDRLTPFREGAAAIALTAARRGDRAIACVPCALKYTYIEDPTPSLLALMDRLEERILWRPRPDLPLMERIYRFADALLSLKETEHLGAPQAGSLPERIARLSDQILKRLEGKHGVSPGESITPERIKALRKAILEKLEDALPHDPAHKHLFDDLDDVFLTAQLFSYPGNYVSQRPTIERIAETLDKFEEDVLDQYTASIRGARRVTVTFGEPIAVETGKKRKDAGAELTRLLESHVQALLDGRTPSSASIESRQPQTETQMA